MNFREGTRRLALLVGVLGAITGGVGSYVELQSAIRQRAEHLRFERLANSDVVKKARDAMIQARANEFQYVKLPDGNYGKFKADADDAAVVAAIEQDFPKTKPWLIYQSLAHRVGGPDFIPNKGTHDDRTPSTPAPYTEQRYAEVDPWQLAAAEGESRQEFSDVNKDGIKTIFWAKGYGVSSVLTEGGQEHLPTPAPAWWTYILISAFPGLGFLIPWGAIRAVGWVVGGFAQPA